MSGVEIKVSRDSAKRLRKIRSLLARASNEFQQLSVVEQDAIHDFHIEGASLKHCLRWGQEAADEIVMEMIVLKAPK